jgi:hypothetical protein
LGSSCCRHFNQKETVTVSYYPDDANPTLNNKLYSIRFQNVIADLSLLLHPRTCGAKCVL